MGRFLFTCTTLFALFVSLSFNLSAQQTLVMVRVNGMDFRLSDPPNGSDPAAHYGTQLKNVLHRLDPFSQCTVWAQHPIQLKVGSGVKTLQEGLVLHFENIELKPTRPFFHIFHLGGNGSTLIGLKVFGDGDNRRVAGDRSAGIGIYGRNCRVLQCTSSTMPDGGNANCFEVFGEYCNVSSCLGINPATPASGPRHTTQSSIALKRLSTVLLPMVKTAQLLLAAKTWTKMTQRMGLLKLPILSSGLNLPMDMRNLRQVAVRLLRLSIPVTYLRMG